MESVVTTLLPDTSAAPFDQLASRLIGRLVTPSDPDYPSVAVPWNVAVPSTPVAVVIAACTDDVVAAVRFASEHGLLVDVRATGHGAIPTAAPTLLVHTGDLDALEVHPEERWARVGAGVRWQRVLDAAAPHGLTGLCGSAPHVGVVGYITGGGLSPIGRNFGFAIDHVRAFELVTATGRVLRVTADQHPDLFWALRGGKGSVGIITAVEIDLLPVATIYGGALYFAADDIATVLHRWAEWAPALPDAASTSVAILRLPPLPDVPPPLAGRTVLAVRYTWLGDPAEGDAVFAPVAGAATPVLGGIGPMPTTAFGAIHAEPVDPMPAVEYGHLLRELPAEAVDALLAIAGPDVECPLAMVELRLLGGALRRRSAPAVFDRRDDAFSLLAIGLGVPPVAAAATAVASSLLTATSRWSDGAQLPHFGGTLTADRLPKVFRPDALQNLARLAELHDPRHVLTATVALRSFSGKDTVYRDLVATTVPDLWD